MGSLAYAAHELRTPLATQRALLELALSDPHTDAATWREIGGDVLGACREQERLLDACLTLARGSLQRREPLDLATIAGEVLRSERRRSITTVAALEPARASGDPDLVERLVVNLISNAVRHNVPGGRLEVGTRTAAGRSVLSVANTGPIVPPAAVARLFEPFHSDGGVGLGLTIVQSVAEAHGATVASRARAGGGLSIDVAFPALD
jgi:signal transduction histidine kinase